MKGVESRELEHELAAVFCEGECGTDRRGDRYQGETYCRGQQHVAEVLERQQLGQITRKCRATVHSKEA